MIVDTRQGGDDRAHATRILHGKARVICEGRELGMLLNKPGVYWTQHLLSPAVDSIGISGHQLLNGLQRINFTWFLVWPES